MIATDEYIRCACSASETSAKPRINSSAPPPPPQVLRGLHHRPRDRVRRGSRSALVAQGGPAHAAAEEHEPMAARLRGRRPRRSRGLRRRRHERVRAQRRQPQRRVFKRERSERKKGLSGGDPPNPPCCRRGRARAQPLMRSPAHALARTCARPHIMRSFAHALARTSARSHKQSPSQALGCTCARSGRARPNLLHVCAGTTAPKW
jgi:hypothetical protein